MNMKSTESNAEKALVELYRQSYECEKLMKELYRESYECAVKHLEVSGKRVLELMAELQVQRNEYMKLLKELGYDLTFEHSPGDHQWKYWDAKIQDVLAWMLG